MRRSPGHGVSTADWETTHGDAPGPALSYADRLGPRRWDRWKRDGWLFGVQARGLGTVPGKIPQAAADL